MRRPTMPARRAGGAGLLGLVLIVVGAAVNSSIMWMSGLVAALVVPMVIEIVSYLRRLA